MLHEILLYEENVCMFFLLESALVSARTWTDVKGRTIKAELVRVDGTTVIVNRNGTELPIQLVTLSQADQEFAVQSNKEHPTEPAATASITQMVSPF